MAKQRYGINDAYRGTVGTVIGYEWRGKWCLRSRPQSVRNPRTERQQANRMLFKQMVALAGRMKGALRKGLRSVSLRQHVTECNLFVKMNKGCFALGDDGCMAVAWADVVVSDGEASAVEVEGVVAGAEEGRQAAPLQVEVSFATRGGGGGDEVYVYAYCPGCGEGVLGCGAPRRRGRAEVELPERWRGSAVHLWCFAVDGKGVASPSVYLGSLEAVETVATAEVAERPEGMLSIAGGGYSHLAVENNLWHESCNRKNSSNFAARKVTPQWKQTSVKIPGRPSPSAATRPYA